MRGGQRGYGAAMTTHPNQPESDEADPEKETTPAGVVRDLERKAEELDTSVEPDGASTPDPDSPGGTFDDPTPAERNEPG